MNSNIDLEDPLNVHLNDETESDGLHWPEPSGSLHATYKRAAVASDHGLCSEIGRYIRSRNCQFIIKTFLFRDILLQGGNAVESMISSLLCIGVVNPQSSGLGGGFLMTLYNA